MDGEGATSAPIPDDEKESETVVFESAQENDMDDMEVISRDQVNESLGDAAMPPMGGIPEEFQQMMREMNRRVESLEGRIDELVDARDRLERQVAAQTEELRVQRAAIARTQRAVRNLARPEDAGEEEATEPALRDPNQ
jgi:septal ring factor EnvC (AmiA/AmiB activator)